MALSRNKVLLTSMLHNNNSVSNTEHGKTYIIETCSAFRPCVLLGLFASARNFYDKSRGSARHWWLKNLRKSHMVFCEFHSLILLLVTLSCHKIYLTIFLNYQPYCFKYDQPNRYHRVVQNCGGCWLLSWIVWTRFGCSLSWVNLLRMLHRQLISILREKLLPEKDVLWAANLISKEFVFSVFL